MNSISVPYLGTALQEPLYELETTLLAAQDKIEAWLEAQWQQTPPPFYTSVDLRNAGFKLAPIDTNLYPAGFNNLNSDFLPLAVRAAHSFLKQISGKAKNLILISESHTRNLLYFESLAVIVEILTQAGFNVRIASLRADLTQPEILTLSSGKSIVLAPLQRKENTLFVSDFNADIIILNNDLSNGLPAILKNLEQPILPPAELGWSQRLKSGHFQCYADLAQAFSDFIGMDPWLINPFFMTSHHLNFLQRQGEAELAEKVDLLLTQIQLKYDEYGISKPPFVVIKADAGTYGMGVISVHSGAEVLALNRKNRTKMAMSKGDRPITQVILQEGVYTIETLDNAVAEPVLYMLGSQVIGGFYRLHEKRTETESLNAPGMKFKPLSFLESEVIPNRFYVYSVIARLANIAASHEQYNISI
jgi:glutamate--cysteine ligase